MNDTPQTAAKDSIEDRARGSATEYFGVEFDASAMSRQGAYIAGYIVAAQQETAAALQRRNWKIACELQDLFIGDHSDYQTLSDRLEAYISKLRGETE